MDTDEQVLSFIKQRISCSSPDKEKSPELHAMVVRYQLHKCNRYCQRKTRFAKNVYVTKCRFNFPRPVCEQGKLHDVSRSLKNRRRIYDLQRSENEVRVNDYNPLLLWLWKANVDIQFISESSLALAHYVSGYVTKAEKSSMQDMWQEVSENKSIYSRLWCFGLRCLRSRECGLYEARGNQPSHLWPIIGNCVHF